MVNLIFLPRILTKSTILLFALIFLSSCFKDTEPPCCDPPPDEYVPTEDIASSFTMKTTANGLSSNDVYDIAISSTVSSLLEHMEVYQYQMMGEQLSSTKPQQMAYGVILLEM